MSLSDEMLLHQEQTFAQAFASGDLQIARPLYHPDVVYISPTVRLFGWPQRIDGIERTLEFIALTIQRCEAIAYRAVEYAIATGGDSAFVRIHFEWTRSSHRLRSNYVVLYRYCDSRISQQEVYYDPSGPPEVLGSAAP